MRPAAARGACSAAVALALALAGVLGVLSPCTAGATQLTSISARFVPERLGAPSSVRLGFHISVPGGGLPSALTGIVFHYPRDLGLGTTGLGVASCSPVTLRVRGPKACPPDSIMGAGSALAVFQVSPTISEESARIALVAGPSEHGYVKMLISATSFYPITARILMSTLLLPGSLEVTVPLVEGVPEGPDVAIAAVQVTLGGRLTYYVRRHGVRHAYHPAGVLLPKRCPRGGFHFSATFSFLDGSRSEAQTVVRCPRRRPPHTPILRRNALTRSS